MPSAPEEKIHGCVGWKATSRTPKSRVRVCPLSTLTGTSNGFCSRSLWKRKAQDPVGWSPGKGGLGKGQHSLVYHAVANDNTAVV